MIPLAKKRSAPRKKSRPARGESGRTRSVRKKVVKKKASNRRGKSAAGRKRKKTVGSRSGSKNTVSRARRPSDPKRHRLQKVLAQAGFGSRRECEALITEGRVEVDGAVTIRLGTTVDPRRERVTVDGARVRADRLQYFMLNKPPGVVSTSRDPAGRLRVIDLIKTNQRVYTVGRLDKSSEGLILVTNDGDLAQQLTHPRFGVEKTYHVQVAGNPRPGDLRKLEQGVRLADGIARASRAKIKRRQKHSADLEIVLEEGRNRIIRRLLAKIGHKVTRLKRIAIGPLRLADLPLGAHRELTSREVESLRKAAAAGKGVRRKKHSAPTTLDAFRRDADAPSSPRRSKTGKKVAKKRPATVRGKTKRKPVKKKSAPARKQHGARKKRRS